MREAYERAAAGNQEAWIDPYNVMRYMKIMIRSFADRETERLWLGHASRKWSAEVARRGLAKLRLLDSAERIEDLRSPPGNRLEMLKGDRRGLYSIRINDQWRICFRWSEGGANDVEIVDYHR